MSDKRSWISSGCGAMDPPIQVRPIKKGVDWRDDQVKDVRNHPGDYPDLSGRSDVNILRKVKSLGDSYTNRD